jgi:hypothetical protein
MIANSNAAMAIGFEPSLAITIRPTASIIMAWTWSLMRLGMSASPTQALPPAPASLHRQKDTRSPTMRPESTLASA